MISPDRKIIRRNRSENRNIQARRENLQIIINHDVTSRLCAGSSARINVKYTLSFWRCQIRWSSFLTSNEYSLVSSQGSLFVILFFSPFCDDYVYVFHSNKWWDHVIGCLSRKKIVILMLSFPFKSLMEPVISYFQ